MWDIRDMWTFVYQSACIWMQTNPEVSSYMYLFTSHPVMVSVACAIVMNGKIFS